MKNARWRQHCNPDWPIAVQDWLRTRGSLTVRLQRTYGAFRVELRRQGCGSVLADEAGLLGVVPGRHVRLRQVTLWAGGQPRVVAHTAVKWLGSQSDWPFWRQLGTRSLGTVLFRDRTVRRGCMQFACLPHRHPLARQASRAVQAAGAIGGRPQWFARRALYRRGAQRTPLAVTEVFLSVDCADRLHTVDGM